MTVTVIGGGLAGAMAALAAAHHRDADVELLTAGETTLQQASGLVDVLGYTPAGEGPLADPFDAIPDLPPEHPYSTVGLDGVRDGLALFDRVTGETYAGADSERNALVPTYGGRLKPTARYPDTVAPGVASRKDATMLVGFEQTTVMDAPLVGETLSAALPYRVWGTTIPFPRQFADPADLVDFADALEADRGGSADAAVPESVRDSLAIAIANRRDADGRVGLPAMLGHASAETIRERIEREVQAHVFEIPTGGPSVLGQRLEATLRQALVGADVEVSTETRVTGFEASDGRIERLDAQRGDESVTVDPEQVVLATGGLVGGGVESDREAVREPLFDCHVGHPTDRYDWSDPDALGAHPFARFGVDTDERLRPLDVGGDPEYANLRAAGSVLGGYNFAAEKSGSGVSIATGVAAGRRAAEDAS